MTARQRRAAESAAWREALAEGRVVRIEEAPGHLTSYPSILTRDVAIAAARAAGLTPEIVRLESTP